MINLSRVLPSSRLIDRERESNRQSETHFDWTAYKNYTQIYEWLDEQIAAHPTVLQERPFGRSYEGRPIRAVRLSRKAGNKAVFIEANIHAREWIASATATWLLNELLTSVDPAIRDLSENLDWYFVPIFNVDGFDFSHRVVSFTPPYDTYHKIESSPACFNASF